MTAQRPGSAQSVGAAVRDAARRFAAAGIASAGLDARVLAAHILGIGQEAVIGRPERILSDDERMRFDAAAEARAARRPLAQILGRREFWSLPFLVTADTLDPRPDSETLIEAALALLEDRPLRVLDLGTGTGCLLLSFLRERPAATGLGIDVDRNAVLVAAENARRLGLAGRAEFRQGNWGDGLDGRFGLILSNPPYIPTGDIAGLEPEVSRHEPLLALSGGPDGLDAYRALCPVLTRLLAPEGIAVVELGQGQAPAVADLFAAAGLRVADVKRDLSGIPRCLVLVCECAPAENEVEEIGKG